MESVEKRERRLKRERNKLAAFRHALRFFEPAAALRNIRGLTATWDAVRRVSSCLLGVEVRDVFVAWAIVSYVKALPDGQKRLRHATDLALQFWAAAAGEELA